MSAPSFCFSLYFVFTSCSSQPGTPPALCADRGSGAGAGAGGDEQEQDGGEGYDDGDEELLDMI